MSDSIDRIRKKVSHITILFDRGPYHHEKAHSMIGKKSLSHLQKIKSSLQAAKTVVITGAPGSGKSHLILKTLGAALKARFLGLNKNVVQLHRPEDLPAALAALERPDHSYRQDTILVVDEIHRLFPPHNNPQASSLERLFSEPDQSKALESLKTRVPAVPMIWISDRCLDSRNPLISDPAWARRVRIYSMPQLQAIDALEILLPQLAQIGPQISRELQLQASLTVTEDGLRAAVALSDLTHPQRMFPAKATELLELVAGDISIHEQPRPAGWTINERAVIDFLSRQPRASSDIIPLDGDRWSRNLLTTTINRLKTDRKALAPAYIPFLVRNCVEDLTALADANELLSAPGREELLEEVTRTLTKPNLANVMLTGEPGSGKTHFVHGLAVYLTELRRTQPLHPLANKRILKINPTALAATNGLAGEFDTKLNALFELIRMNPNAILVIDESAQAMGAGTSQHQPDGLLSRLKEIMTNPTVRTSMIFITTTAEFLALKKANRDPALFNRLQPVEVLPLTAAQIRQSIGALKEQIEQRTKLHLQRTYPAFEITYSIQAEAIDRALELAKSRHGRSDTRMVMELLDNATAAEALSRYYETQQRRQEGMPQPDGGAGIGLVAPPPVLPESERSPLLEVKVGVASVEAASRKMLARQEDVVASAAALSHYQEIQDRQHVAHQPDGGVVVGRDAMEPAPLASDLHPLLAVEVDVSVMDAPSRNMLPRQVAVAQQPPAPIAKASFIQRVLSLPSYVGRLTVICLLRILQLFVLVLMAARRMMSQCWPKTGSL